MIFVGQQELLMLSSAAKILSVIYNYFENISSTLYGFRESNLMDICREQGMAVVLFSFTLSKTFILKVTSQVISYKLDF